MTPFVDDLLPQPIGETLNAIVARDPVSNPVASRHLLLTLLYTDIVGSTRAAERMGDAAWHALLQWHRKVIRAQLAHRGGREIDCCGDGFLAAFGSPASAIWCAAAICDALVASGLQIRTGIHAGECCFDGARVAGIAVHVAARIVAVARPMEVLVSDTVRDLVAGSGLAFLDRGRHVLKGISRQRRLFAFRPVDGQHDDPSAFASLSLANLDHVSDATRPVSTAGVCLPLKGPAY